MLKGIEYDVHQNNACKTSLSQIKVVLSAVDFQVVFLNGQNVCTCPYIISTLNFKYSINALGLNLQHFLLTKDKY